MTLALTRSDLPPRAQQSSSFLAVMPDCIQLCMPRPEEQPTPQHHLLSHGPRAGYDRRRQSRSQHAGRLMIQPHLREPTVNHRRLKARESRYMLELAKSLDNRRDRERNPFHMTPKSDADTDGHRSSGSGLTPRWQSG